MILSVIGTRPQLVKLSSIHSAFADVGIQHMYIDSGQHYDPNLSSNLQIEFGLPDPVINLKSGSDTHANQTAKIMLTLEVALNDLKPDAVIVYGDTNSTLAACLVASKRGILVAHVEAGLRSKNRRMPEELNRIATDHLSDILFAPTQAAISNLNSEGLGDKSFLVGDVMCDLLLSEMEKLIPINPQAFGVNLPYLVCTLHRAENTDDPEKLESILMALGTLPYKIVFFAHPRLLQRMTDFNLKFPLNFVLRPPATHGELMRWMVSSTGVVTDSGGLQKEAFILQVPCTTLRSETEWVETLKNGWNVLVPDEQRLLELINTTRKESSTNPFGHGDAAQKIVENLLSLKNV